MHRLKILQKQHKIHVSITQSKVGKKPRVPRPQKTRAVTMETLPICVPAQESIATTTPPKPKNWHLRPHGEVLPTGMLTPTPATARFRFAAYPFEMGALAASKAVTARIPLYQKLLNKVFLLVLLFRYSGNFFRKLFPILINFFQLIMKAEVGATNDSVITTIH